MGPLMISPPLVPYNKKFTTISDQIKRLEERGMSIDDKRMAAFWLYRVGYYRLSGYWYELREQDGTIPGSHRKDDFKPDSKFNDVVDLYLFDENLRILILKALSPIEVAFRAQIMYVLVRVNDKAYLDISFFQRNFTQPIQGQTKSQYNNWLEKIESSVERSKNEPFLEHFLKKYCHPPGSTWWKALPLWIMVDCWDFGTLSKCCSGLETRWCTQVAKKFSSIPVPILKSWIYTLNTARNFSAHHSRIWNRWWNVAIPKMPSNKEMKGLFAHIAAIYQTDKRIQRSTYMVLAIIKYFLLWSIEDKGISWSLEIKSLLNKFPHAFGGPNKLGFPENWEKEPLWNL